MEKRYTVLEWSDKMILYSVLATIKSLLESNTPEESFFGHNAKDSIINIDGAINSFYDCENKINLKDLVYEFAPTGPLQELSMANGWGEIYIKLADAFDKTIYCLNGKKPN